MKKLQHCFQKEEGFSLTELLVVISIIVVLSTIAFMKAGTSKEQFARQNVAIELKNAFERARFDSVKRRANSESIQAKVVVNTTTYSLVTDNNLDGDVIDAEDSLPSDFAAQNITITDLNQTSMTFPVTVYFTQRGEAIAKDSDGVVNPIFLMCNGTCDHSNDNSSNANIVLVTPTGTVNLLAGGSSVPTFVAPSPITSVPVTSNIKNYTMLP